MPTCISATRPTNATYGIGANILHSLGIKKMRLLTNNPVKRIGLEGYGIDVTEIVPLEVEPNEYNRCYMHTKKCVWA